MKKLNTMRSVLMTILGVLLFQASYAQHQFHQSQYMHHKPFINPGALSYYNSLNAALFHKSQWAGFDGAPSIQGFSILKPFKEYKMAWGAQFVHDKIGVHNSYDLSGSYAYRVQLKQDMKLGLGLTTTLRMQQSNYTEATTTVSNDPTFAQNTPLLVMPNFRFGAYLWTPDYFLGLTMPNLLKNRVSYDASTGETSFDTQDMHMYLNGGYKLEVSREVDITPSVLFRYANGSPLQWELNVNGVFDKKMGFGITYRSSKEVVLMGNYEVKEKFWIGYSYDIGFSDLALFSNGSHEIMMIYKVRTSIKEDEHKPKDRIEI